MQNREEERPSVLEVELFQHPFVTVTSNKPVPEETTAEVTVQVKIEIEESEIALQLPANTQASYLSNASSEEEKLTQNTCLLESASEKLEHVSATETSVNTLVEQTVTVEANKVEIEKSKENVSDPPKENPEKLQNESFLLGEHVETKESKAQNAVLKEDIDLQKERKDTDVVVTETNVDPKKDNDFANEGQLCQFNTETVTLLQQLIGHKHRKASNPVPEETTAEVTVQVKIEIEESEIALQLPANTQASYLSNASSEEEKLTQNTCLLESASEKLEHVSATETSVNTLVEQTVTVEANKVEIEKSKENVSDPPKENPEKLQNESFLLGEHVETKESKAQNAVLKEDIDLQKERKDTDVVVTETNVDPKKDNDFANEGQLCQFNTETVTLLQQLIGHKHRKASNPVPEETTAEVTVQVKIEIEESEIALQLPANTQASYLSNASSEEEKLTQNTCLLESASEKLEHVSATETSVNTLVEQTVTVEANKVEIEKSKENVSDPPKENPEKLQNESFLLGEHVETKESKAQNAVLKEDIDLQKERKDTDVVVTETNVDPKKDNDFANEGQLCQFNTETVTLNESGEEERYAAMMLTPWD
ncbi:UNVERIFIED_CONTAM: hypothetical protein K2H54_051904 [Gekko kuhli]